MKLADICEINPRAELLDDNTLVSFVAMPDVSEDGKINVDTHRTYGEVKKGFTNFKEGDVIFAKITPCMENGKGALATGLENGLGFGSTEFHVLRPNATIVLGQWLYYLTSWSAFRKDAEKHMTGSAGQKRVPKSFLEKYEVDLPTIDDQVYQVLQLNRIRKIIDARRQQLSALDDLIKARFVEMFGDPVSNSMCLPVECMGERYTLKAGITTSADEIHDFSVGEFEIPCYGGNGIRGYVENASYDGSFPIIGRQGALCGNVQFASGKFHATEHAVLVSTLKDDDPIWTYYMLQMMDLYRFHTGAAQPGLAVKTLNTVDIIVTNKERQKEFVAFVTQIDKSKSVIQKALEETQLLFDSLMQKYFG